MMSTPSKSTPSTPTWPRGPLSQITIYINVPLAIACWATTLLNENGTFIPQLLSPFILPSVDIATAYFLISMFLLPGLTAWLDV